MSVEPGLLLIRVDGDASVGTGHVMRQIALGQAWRRAGGRVRFLSCTLDPVLRDALDQQDFTWTLLDGPPASQNDAHNTREAVAAAVPDWLVLDGYPFGTEFQASVRVDGVRQLVVDDFANHLLYHADLILDQNLAPGDYAVAARRGDLLAGPRFALLRKEFWDREPERDRNGVLVTFGGSPQRATFDAAIAALTRHAPGLTIHAVEGTSAMSRRDAPENVTLHGRVANMADLMAKVEWAVAAGGSTCWELCRMALPMVLVTVAENQVGNVRALCDAGVAVSAGRATEDARRRIEECIQHMLEDIDARTRMAKRAAALVDGQGAHRVVARMREMTPIRSSQEGAP